MSIFQILFSFEGRISRQPYWIGWIILNIVVLVGQMSGSSDLSLILSVLIIWPGLALQAKRWHDRNKSAWWILLNFTIIGIPWVLVELLFFKGTDGPNEYGLDPLKPWETELVASKQPNAGHVTL